MKRGDWSLVEADVETLFSKSPETMWRELNRQASGLWVQAAERRVGMARLSDSYTEYPPFPLLQEGTIDPRRASN